MIFKLWWKFNGKLTHGSEKGSWMDFLQGQVECSGEYAEVKSATPKKVAQKASSSSPKRSEEGPSSSKEKDCS